MSTVHVGGVRFRVFPQDHFPIHAHARYAETSITVVFGECGAASLGSGLERIPPANRKRSDVRKILDAADECYDLIKATWEVMHAEK